MLEYVVQREPNQPEFSANVHRRFVDEVNHSNYWPIPKGSNYN